MRAVLLALTLGLASGLAAGSGEASEQPDVAAAIARLGDALEHNDVAGVEQRTTDDWRVIDADGAVIGRDRFLAVLRSGALSHEVMDADEQEIRRFGEVAVVTARMRGAGHYGGARFTFDERSIDVWVLRDGRWLCQLTQLTRIAPARAD